jgi:acyl-CoA synthetase (AMP-forming)/AMP-acid ligase II
MLQMHKRGWPNQPKFWHGPGRKPAKGLCGNERGTGRSILAVRYYDWIAHFSRRTPDKTAVVDLASERRFSYAQFDARIARLATHLTERLGVNRGDRVAVLALNTTDTLEVQFACGRLGAIFVPLNIRLNVPELEFIVGDAAPKVMVHDTDLADTALAVARACDVPSGLLLGPGGTYEAAIAAATRLKRSEDVTLDDVSTIMYTSGATGRPKGAMITHGMTFWNCVNLGGPAYITPSSVLLTVLPLFHTGGLNCYTKQQGYGMTETSPAVLALDREDAARKAGSAGKPVLHTEVRVVRPDGTDVAPGELGELWVRGPNVTPGYWNRPDANKSSFTDGWLHTGDATRVDDEGFYYIVDRWKGHVHLRRRECLPSRSRECAAPAFGDLGSRGHRHPRPAMGRNRHGDRRREAGPGDHGSRDLRALLQKSRALQMPATDPVRRGAAAQCDRQNPQTDTPTEFLGCLGHRHRPGESLVKCLSNHEESKGIALS